MNILLVDDHHLFREGVRLILSQIQQDTRFMQAESFEDAIAMSEAEVDVILLDYHLPGKSGCESICEMRDAFDKAVIVILSGEDDPEKIREVIDCGACGFIPKASSPETLLAALSAVMNGGIYLPATALEDSSPPDDGPRAAIRGLSDRQREVLDRAVKGALNKVIAAELNIAEGTVKAHLSAAYRALGVSNRTEAVYLLSQMHHG